MPNATSPGRRTFLKAGGALTLAGRVPAAIAAPDPSRIALVIGNDAYSSLRALRNAVNDAGAVRDLLGRANFSITYKSDIDRAAFAAAIAAFGEAVVRPEVKQAVFYYAGHGAQVEWRNFLLPVDARVGASADLANQGVELGTLLANLSRARGKVFVLILDACRDDPFGQSLQLAQRGLSQFDAPPGTLIAFSTSPGATAADGAGANGLYTENLVRELAVRDARIEDALKRVRLSVRLASRGAQLPWEATSLESEVVLFPSATVKLSEAEIEAEFQRELALWNRIKGSRSSDDWIGYLQKYPAGRFTEIAQNRVDTLLAAAEREAVAKAAMTLAAAKPPAEPVAAPSPLLATAVSTPAQLVIGPGSPPVVLMRPSPNPASAGTYPAARKFSVGDEIVYADYDNFRRRLPDRRFVVTRIDEAADVVEFNDGMYLWDTMGNTIKSEKGTFDPRIQHVPAEFQIGRTWTTRFRVASAARPTDVYYDYRVVARERVKTLAGEFDAFRLEARGFNVQWGTQLGMVAWQVPGLNFMLKYEFTSRDRNSVVAGGEVREMISCRQVRWSAV